MAGTASRKILGFEGHFYTAIGSGSSTKLAHFSGYEIAVAADEVNADDHDSAGWHDFLDGYKKWSATIDMITFANDASQEAIIAAMLTGGVDITCEFRPIDASGEKNWTGTGRITSFKETAKGSTAQARNLQLSGRGALTRGVIASS